MTPDEILQRANDARALIDTLESVELASAGLRARYGAGGTFDADRKTLLCTLRDQFRVNATTKLTEAALDDLAHGHPDYVAFLDNARVERTQLAEYDAQRVALDHRIALAKALLYAHSRLAGVV